MPTKILGFRYLAHPFYWLLQEADRRIAKALQDQERAFMLLDDLAG